MTTNQNDKVTMTESEWAALGHRLYGDDGLKWKFKCPVCGHVQAVEDFQQFKSAGAEPDDATRACIGRWLPEDQRRDAFPNQREIQKVEAPCDYAAFGLFRLGITILRPGGKEVEAFPFAHKHVDGEVVPND